MTLHRHRPITDIALATGFTSSSTFAKRFKERFAMTATQWRQRGSLDQLTASLHVSGISASYGVVDIVPGEQGFRWVIAAGSLPHATVSIENLTDQRLAYVRRTGPYRGRKDVYAEAFTALAKWAQPRDLMRPDATYFSLAHDPPDITEESRHRISVGIGVDQDVAVAGEVNDMLLPGGDYAVATFTLRDEYEDAWRAMMVGWLADSGFETDERLPFERYRGDAQPDEPGTNVVDICLPVRPMRDY